MIEPRKPLLAEPIFDELAIIGVGLIGSSLARAVRGSNAARRIVIANSSEKTLASARTLGLGDELTDDLAHAVRNADCVILCAPVGANEGIGRTIASALRPGVIVSDVGSVKGAVLSTLATNSSVTRPVCPRSSGSGNGTIRPRSGVRFSFCKSMVHFDAAAWRGQECGRKGPRFLGGLGFER